MCYSKHTGLMGEAEFCKSKSLLNMLEECKFWTCYNAFKISDVLRNSESEKLKSRNL